MKNLSKLLGIGCCVLLLTGCNEEQVEQHTLKCSHNEYGIEANLTFKYNDEETEIQKAKMDVTVTAPEILMDGINSLVGFNITDLAQYMSSDDICEAYGVDSGDCYGYFKDNTIYIEVTMTPEELATQFNGIEPNMSMDEVSEVASEEDFICE